MTNAEFEIDFFESVLKSVPNCVDALIPLAEAYTRKGLYQKGLEVDERLAKLCPQDPIVFYNLACSYALLGFQDPALSALQESIRLGYDDFAHLKKDPDLKSLHSNNSFQDLLKNNTGKANK